MPSLMPLEELPGAGNFAVTPDNVSLGDADHCGYVPVERGQGSRRNFSRIPPSWTCPEPILTRQDMQ